MRARAYVAGVITQHTRTTLPSWLTALWVCLSACTLTPGHTPVTLYDAPAGHRLDPLQYELSLATYNVQGLRNPRGVAHTIQALPWIDVWVFQEVNAPAQKPPRRVAMRPSQPPDALRHALPPGEWHALFVPMNPAAGGRAWEGMAIASRMPVQETEIWTLRATSAKRRAALCAKLALPNGRSIWVVNTDHEVGVFSITPDDRQQQVDDLLEKLQSPAFAKHPLALLGDFNTTGRPLRLCGASAADEVGALRESLARAGMDPLPGGDPPNTFRAFPVTYPLDHIFTRGLLAVRWGATHSYSGSDHRPLWVTARIVNHGSPAGAAAP
ncbi:MAG: endonuclease/exonuclease/phosphatase family protein [Planctomycetota bacterium]